VVSVTSIAVIVLDTLRKDAFDEYFDWLPGKRFENAWSTGSWTVPAHASLFTGRYPSEVGVHAKSELLDCEMPTIAEQLQHVGYATSAFTCNPYISDTFDFDRGFDEIDGSWRLRNLNPEFFDWSSFVSETRDDGPARFLRACVECARADVDTLGSLKHGLVLKLREMGHGALVGSDNEGGKRALQWVRNQSFKKHQFLYMNLMEAHAPYNPPQKYRTIQLSQSPGLEETVTGVQPDVDADEVRQAYNDCVRYLSDVYREMFAELRSEFEYVITLGDHGECFGEHGVWKHEHGLVPELTHVPLSVYGGDDAKERNDRCVSLLDVHRTVLALAGVDNDSRGQNLLSGTRDGRYLTEFHGLSPRKAKRLRLEGVSEERINEHDTMLRGVALENGYYGYETLGAVAERGRSPAADPKSAMSSLVADLDLRDTQGNEPDLSEEVLEQLADLGYA
jgi:arylsulfatase A-like enzyme